MVSEDVLNSLLKLTPSERFELVDCIPNSLDRPDPELDRIWIDEAERRLAAYRAGHAQGIPGEDILGPFIVCPP